MKRIIAANLVILIALTVKATQDFKNKDESVFNKHINAQAKTAVELSNLKDQADFAKRTAATYKEKYEKVLQEKEVLLSEYKAYKIRSEKLVEVLDEKGLITPEIAKYTQRYDGRLPASDE
ncbi:hypothetical protein [Halobacteriovorax sp.]|uniref:hypothetical protein n=1 Tax=Halobacteriovorax sp. TaxID=2020862 RepID=UPI003AF2A8DE